MILARARNGEIICGNAAKNIRHVLAWRAKYAALRLHLSSALPGFADCHEELRPFAAVRKDKVSSFPAIMRHVDRGKRIIGHNLQTFPRFQP